MKRADGRIGHVKKHETLKEVLSPGSKLQNLLQKFNRSWRRNLDNGLGRINSRRSSLKLNMALNITPSNHGMNKFLGGPRPQARTRPQALKEQAARVKTTSHRLNSWDPVPQSSDLCPLIKFYGQRNEGLWLGFHHDKSILWMPYMEGNLVW